MEKWKLLERHAKYLWRAQTKYQVHSPFVFEFMEEVLDDQRHYYAFDELEFLRKTLKKNKSPLKKQDFGAGSLITNTKNTTIAEIAKYNQSHPRVGQMLFRLINWRKPEYLVELGTAFGVTTLYQALASLNGQMTTIEGCEATAKVAKSSFEMIKAKNINLIVGQFDEVLASVLEQLPRLDYIFIDGNHRKDPTLKYFEMCLPYINNDSIFVFDDVRWSNGMNEAWQAIKAHPKVKLTLEVFDVGIVFFRTEQKEKEHFELLPSRLKPLNSFLIK